MQLEHAFLYQVLRGHPEAVGFVTALGRISQVLDDLYDGDKPVTRPQLDETFWDLLVGLPANPFYRAHFAYLHPLVTAAYVDWRDANALEGGTEHERHIAWVIRDNLAAVVSACALLVGGPGWQRAVSVRIRRWVHDEPWMPSRVPGAD